MRNDLPNAKTEALRRHGEAVTAAVGAGLPLSEALSDLILALEAETEVEMMGSVLLVKGGRLVHAAAPSLPAAYNAAIDGIEIGPAVGSCGTAAYYGEPVFVDDIKSDPLWVDFKTLALEHGLRACWSMPIKDDAGQVIGTFANYYRQARHPRAADFAAIEMMAGYAAQAMKLGAAKTPV